MTAPIHFYLTFNPYLNKDHALEFTQAHEFFELLQEQIKNGKGANAYWGKIIGKDRKSNLDISKFEAVISNNNEQGNSTHLYICDFTNIWVAKVESVSDSITNKSAKLDFYQDKNVEVWFEISDCTLLEYSAEETANKLSELYIDNPNMDLVINGLSPFTTGIKYPAFVQDLSEEAYFDEFDKSECSHLALKYNPAVNSTIAKQVLEMIHLYMLPEDLYSKIPHAAKTEIESAEMDMLEKRHHNSSKNVFSYVKAIEVIFNDLVMGHIKRSGYGEHFFVDVDSMPPKLYFEEREGCVEITKYKKNYSLMQLVHFVRRCDQSNNFAFKKAYSKHKDFVNFVLKDFVKIVEDNHLVEIRGILAHNDSNAISEKDALAIRNLIMGIGHRGLICQLYRSFYPDKFKDMAKVTGTYQSHKSLSKLKNKKAA